VTDEVIPAFYERDAGGLPQAWLEMARASLRTCGPRFGAGRMIEDYAARIYPAR
jgi:glycogen phosphorylase